MSIIEKDISLFDKFVIYHIEHILIIRNNNFIRRISFSEYLSQFVKRK